MNERNKAKVGDLVTMNARSLTKKDSPNVISYLDTSSLTTNQISAFQTLRFDEAPVRARRLVKQGDILYSTVRPNQRHYGYLKQLPSRNMVVSTGFAVIEANSKHMDSEYLYYWLTQEKITQKLQQVADLAVTSYPSITPDDIEELIIEYPEDIDVQKNIARTLSLLDEKIALNRRLNHNLEAMARLLYDYWFVQFDFPDENGKPYRSSGGKMVWNEKLKRELPEGWEVTKLADLIEPLVTGKLDANASEDGGKYPFFTCSAAPLEINSFSFDEDAIILAGNGDFYIFDYNGKFDAYQRDYVIIPKEGESKQYLYLTIARNLRILKDKAQGSIIKFLTKGMIENIPVFALDWNHYQVLKRTLQNIFVKRFNAQKEIATLTKQRDFLLPLLMNGQVQVRPQGELNKL